MAKKDRTYKIIEAVIGGPPQGSPALGDRHGNIIPSGQPLIFNKDTDKIRKVDHYRIRFDIKDFSKSPLRFVPNEQDVFWVQPGATCPTAPCQMPGVIWVDKIAEDGEWIDVINMDMTPERFQFTLNFVEKSNPTGPYVPLDPPGSNENGGLAGSDAMLSNYAVLTLGFGTGLLAFFGARLFLAGW